MFENILRFISSFFIFNKDDKQLAREMQFDDRVLALQILHL